MPPVLLIQIIQNNNYCYFDVSVKETTALDSQTVLYYSIDNYRFVYALSPSLFTLITLSHENVLHFENCHLSFRADPASLPNAHAHRYS